MKTKYQKAVPNPQRELLDQLQQRIDRYQPLLEHEFKVSLGRVVAAPLRVGELVDHAFEKSRQSLWRESFTRRGRPPDVWRRLLFATEKLLVRLPAQACFCLRFWFPALVMKWRCEPPAILVSLYGWSAKDRQLNVKRFDQYAVHELAHGVWSRLAVGGPEDREARWWLWNEGFAHYLADTHLRAAYPSDAEVNAKWSAKRERARSLVTNLVATRGGAVLREIPQRWPEFDSQLTDRPA